MANQRWKVSLTPLHNLFDHWLHCHALFEEDKKYLKHLYELSYEDYVRDPAKYHEEIAAFIGTRVPESSMEQVTGQYNERYFNRWSDLWNNSGFTGYYRFIALQYEPKFMNYGYSLTKGFDINEERLREGERISATAGALYRLLAHAYALMVRLTTRSKGYIKKQLRTHLPGPVKVIVGMLFSDSRKVLFVHIQKTGGETVAGILAKHAPDIRRLGAKHEFASFGKLKLGSAWNNYFKFAFVRNPWDRLVSWYSMIRRATRITRLDALLSSRKRSHLQQRASNPLWRYFYENCSSFEEFIKNCTDQVEVADGALYSFAYNQLDYLEDGNGSILVDFIGRVENFSEDLRT